jgi:bifunctional non-homologous end joining protein LigD
MAKRTQTRFIARMIEGAIPSADMPGSIPPQFATLKAKAPVGEKWVHEIKYDGYRVQIHLNKRRITIFTRNGHDWTNRFPIIAEGFDIRGSVPSSTARLSLFTKAAPTFPNYRPTSPRGNNAGWSITHSTFCFWKGSTRKSPQIERKRVLKMLFDETKMHSGPAGAESGGAARAPVLRRVTARNANSGRRHEFCAAACVRSS